MSNVTALSFDLDLTIEAASTTYAEADTSTKASLRAQVAESIQAAIMAADLPLAQHLVGIQSAMKAQPKVTTGPDYAQLVADHVATLEAALESAREGRLIMPEGVTVPESAEIAARVGVVDTKRAESYLLVSGRKAGRGAVLTYVTEALERLGRSATIAEIRAAHVPSEDYPKAAPSAGAIGAAFDRIESGKVEDSSVEVIDLDGKRGARLA